MAIYRPIQISFCQDGFVLRLSSDEKFFYIYLMTNSKTRQCGIYELPLQIIVTETKFNEKKVKDLIKKFVAFGKIKYDFENEEVYLLNWVKYNQIANGNVGKCVIGELQTTKNIEFALEFLKKLPKINNSKDRNLEIEGACKGLLQKNKPIGSKQSSTETPTEEETETKPPTQPQSDLESVQEIWNSFAKQHKLSQIKDLTTDRKAKLRKRLENPLFKLYDILEVIKTNDFLKGGGSTGWKVSFDFIIENELNYLKILEGNYNGNGQHQKNGFTNTSKFGESEIERQRQLNAELLAERGYKTPDTAGSNTDTSEIIRVG